LTSLVLGRASLFPSERSASTGRPPLGRPEARPTPQRRTVRA